MIYRGSIPQATLRFFVTCYVLMLLLGLAYSYAVYRNGMHALDQRRDYALALFTRYMESRHEQAERVLRDVAAQVVVVKGDLPAIRAIIDEEVNQKGFQMRVAWSDAKMQLMVGTAIGLFDPHADSAYLADYRMDLSDRLYIQQARSQPGRVIVSHLLHHKVTGRSFFAIAQGVSDSKGRYLGTLADIVDQQTVADMLRGTLQDASLQGRLLLPNGDTVFSNYSHTTPEDERLLIGGYRLAIELMPQQRQQLWDRYLTESALIGLFITLLFFAFYQSFARRLAGPVQEALQLLFGKNGKDMAAPLGNLALPMLLPKIRELQELMGDYDDLRTRLDDREDKLHTAAELLLDVRQEYYGTLGSLSQELQQVFDAIQHYGELCRDASHTGSEDAYQQHFEVEEFGLNLKFIANALYLVCQENYGKLRLQPETLFIDAYIEESLSRCQEVIEDKTVDIRYAASQASFHHDETLIRYLADGVVFSVWRYMAYASKAEIKVEILGEGEELRLSAHVRELEDIFLPPNHVMPAFSFPAGVSPLPKPLPSI